MADDVQIVFGAKIDDLVANVDKVKVHLHGVEQKVGDIGTHNAGAFTQLHSLLAGLSSPLSGIRQNLGELAEGFAAAFGLEKIISLIEKMAELGTTTARTAAILGISTGTVGQLNVVAKSTGSTLESLMMTTERLALNIQRSAASATAPAALALGKLGLSAKDFIGLGADQYILKIADAASKFNMNFNMSQALMALGGRGMQSLIPIIAEGREGIEHLQKSAVDVGATLSTQTTHALESIHKNLVLLTSAIEASSARLVARFAPAINTIIETMTRWVTSMSEVSASGRIFDSLIDQMAYMVTSLGISLFKMTEAMEAFLRFDFAGVKAAWASHEAEQEKALKTHMDNMAKIAADGKIAIAGALGGGHDEHKPEKPDIGPLGISNSDAVSAAMKAADGQVKALQAGLVQQKLLLDQGLAQFQLTESQKVAAVQRATDEQAALEMDVLKKELTIANMTATQRETVLNKISALEQKYTTESIRLNGEAVAAIQQKWQQLGDALQSSFNAQLRGLLAGTTSWAQAFKTITGDMIIFFIQEVEKMVFKWLVKTATMATIDKEAAVQSTATAAAAQAAQTATAAASVQQKVAQVYAGAAAFFAPLLGPGAPAAAAAVAAETEAGAAAFLLAGAAEQGAWNIPDTAPWLLHKGETVLPAPAAQAFRDMAQGGTGGSARGDTHLHVHAIDAAGVMALFRDNARGLTKMIGDQLQGNPTLREAFKS